MAGDDLEARVSALEEQVRDLAGRVQVSEHDAAAARVLAGAADRDVSAIQAELRDFRQATNTSFNALRQDFVDLRAHVDQGFTEVNQAFTEVNQAFTGVNQAFTEVRGKLDGAAAGQQRIADLIQTLIDRR